MSILKYDNIDVTKINYSKPEKIGPSYFGSMSYGDNLKPFYIQTPKLKCLTGIEEMKDKKNPYLEVEIPKGRFDIYDLFLSLDDQNIKTTVKNSEEWFKKDLPLEAIDDMYKRTTKPFKKDSNPSLKFRLPVIKNEIQCSVYNQQKVFVDLDEIKEGSEVMLILHVRGLKILKQYFYCDCYISQVKVFQENNESKFNIIKEYALVDDDEEDETNFDDIFDEEIIKTFEEEKRLQKEKEEEKKRLQKEKEEEEKRLQKEKEERIKQIQEDIKRKEEEMKQLLNN
tara:strand:+ start:679 stop:1527 length:849 start_codon:yes stop_codon:yes gene_type:complete